MLKRELSKLDNYATIVGMMVGSGIFVAIGEAGKDAGPATILAYVLLGPITLLLALPYIIFQSTPLGNITGGAYIHISRTFKNHFVAFIVMWLTWVTYLGVLSVLAISVGRYLQALVPGLDPRIAATACLVLFYLINLTGVKQFGRMQSAMFYILMLAVILLIFPGIYAVKASNLTPFMPHGWAGFLKALPVLFFAYAGFDALSQTAGETKDARHSLPKIFFFGICAAIAIYVGISLVAFGTTPFESIISSQAPLVDASRSFLPAGVGPVIVTTGALMAFLTTINACMMVPSRLLYAFAQDRVVPSILSRLNARFGTPDVSLTINLVLAVVLIWTKTMGYLIGITMQAMIILYATESMAMMCLPFVNKTLWHYVPYKLNRIWVVAAGAVSVTALIVLYAHIPDPLPLPLVIWTLIGTAFYAMERRRGILDKFDYRATLTAFEESPRSPMPEGA
jgi:APA family basic amino acid/polyamine antiporter